MTNEAEKLSDSLSEFQRRFAQLPDVEKPPQTAFQVINRSSREVYWNRMLSYLLDPTEPHGFDTEFLERFLLVLKRNPKLGFTFDRRHFGKIEVESEVTTPEGNVPDILIRSGREWFICIEMKVGATEGMNQTERYANDEYVGDVLKEEFPEEGRHYVYLAEKDAADASADEFINVTWRAAVNEFERFQTSSQGRYPSRSSAQLDDFLETIRDELNMSNNDFEQNQMARAKLYLEYAEEIDEASSAFKSFHEEAVANWKKRFLSDFEPATWNDKWNCGAQEWGQIYRDNWRLDEDLNNTHDEGEALVCIQFVHKIRNNESFKNGQLKFKLEWPGSSDLRDRFRKQFYRDDTKAQLRPLLNKYNIDMVQGSTLDYTQKVYEFDQLRLPDSYYETLQTAFEEHQEMADDITEILETTLDEIKSE